jgi:hypothetical protein
MVSSFLFLVSAILISRHDTVVAIELNNFIRMHKTLRVTPAMEAAKTILTPRIVSLQSSEFSAIFP